MGKEVLAAAKADGIKAAEIKSVQSQVNAIDLMPIADLFDWNGSFFTWSLRAIDLVQATLWAMQLIDPENAAKIAALLQKIEDFINERRGQPTAVRRPARSKSTKRRRK